jgi:CDGSH-type Zn-finger protein
MAPKADLVITPYRDGPVLVRGRFRLIGADGRELEHRREPIALCRCGKSRLRPLCDGTHKLIGFRAPGTLDSTGSAVACDLQGLSVEICEQGSETV